MDSSQGSSLTTDTMSPAPKKHHIPNLSRKRHARNKAIELMQEDRVMKEVIERVLNQHPPRHSRQMKHQVENTSSEASFHVNARLGGISQGQGQHDLHTENERDVTEYNIDFCDMGQSDVKSPSSKGVGVPRMSSMVTAVVSNCSDDSFSGHRSDCIVTAVISNRTRRPIRLVSPDRFQELQSTIERKLLSGLGEEDTIAGSKMVDEDKDADVNTIKAGNPKEVPDVSSRSSPPGAPPDDRSLSFGKHCRKSLPHDDDMEETIEANKEKGQKTTAMQDKSPSIGSHLQKSGPKKLEDEDERSESINAPSQHHFRADDDNNNNCQKTKGENKHRRRSRSRSRRKRRNGSYAPSKTLVESSGNVPGDGSDDECKSDFCHVLDQFILDSNSGRIGRFTGTIDKKSGMPHGKNAGKMEYPGATSLEFESYEGDWDQGSWTGFGRHVKSNGDVYNGEFLFNVKHGTGIYSYRDGRRRFEGRYRDGDRVEGKMTYGDGSVYVGAWFNGQRHGRGLYTFGDGTKYEGEFQGDMLHGAGTLTFPDRFSFIGEFRRGKRHGHGKEFSADGTIVDEGIWKEGVPV